MFIFLYESRLKMFRFLSHFLIFTFFLVLTYYLSTNQKKVTRMRFLYRRPKMDLINEELNTVMEVMVSDVFVYLDLFVFSLIFTLLLSPVLPSIAMSILFFLACYGLFSCLYFLIFNRILKKY